MKMTKNIRTMERFKESGDKICMIKYHTGDYASSEACCRSLQKTSKSSKYNVVVRRKKEKIFLINMSLLDGVADYYETAYILHNCNKPGFDVVLNKTLKTIEIY